MPRITHVAKAQQRYATAPVLDADGQPQQTPVMSNGVQKTTKTGRPVFRAVTVPDKDRPLPLAECDYASCPAADRTIAVGTPYKHMSIKTGPSTSRTLTRHEDCPAWNTWDYSTSMRARLDQIVDTARRDINNATEKTDIEDAMSAAAEEIREIAEEKAEASNNIEDGFGAANAASEELAEHADALEAWASEIEYADIPEPDECSGCGASGEVECPVCEGECTVDCTDCSGTGQVDGDDCEHCEDGKVDCTECSGSGQADCDSDCVDGFDTEAWRDEIESATDILNDCPV